MSARLLALETKSEGFKEKIMTEFSTPTLEPAAAAVPSSTTSSFSNILPAILTPIATIFFVILLVVSLKTCTYQKNKRNRRALDAAKESERIRHSHDETSPTKYINRATLNDNEDDNNSKKVNGGEPLYQPIESASSVFDFSEEAESEDAMISSPLGKYITVEAEMHPLTAMEERPSPKTCRSSNIDENNAVAPLCATSM